MARIDFADPARTPLTTDHRILQRADALVGGATGRRMWMMFLDHEHRQLRIVMPMTGVPELPDVWSARKIATRLADVVAMLEARQAFVVWERRGPQALTTAEVRWVRSLIAAAEECGLELRAQLLSHNGGVRWIALDDWIGG